MATHRVDVVRISRIEPHPNADRLEIAFLFDWPVIVSKGRYQAGELVIYCPVNSVLSSNLEGRLFPPESKIKLSKSRVRAIKIRGYVSQGMIIDPIDVSDAVTPEDLTEGNNVAEILDITKYEPPVEETPGLLKLQKKKPKPDLQAFKKYTDVEHGKYYSQELTEGEEVVITQKIHGTSFRAGWFKTEANVWWQKIFKFFGLLPEWTFAWGSRNVQIQAKLSKKHVGCRIEAQGVNFDDVYTKIVKQYDLKNRLPKGVAIYGEIAGDGIQKGYMYGCNAGEHKLYLYDIMVDGRWLDYYNHSDGQGYDEQGFVGLASKLNLRTVPIVYQGPLQWQMLGEFLSFNAISEEVNEGVVVRPAQERNSPAFGRVLLKWINDEFYAREQTDFH